MSRVIRWPKPSGASFGAQLAVGGLVENRGLIELGGPDDNRPGILTTKDIRTARARW
ncbi:MAG: hypothetical protein R2706_18260 [Acidimicrobiales bacterium]